MHRYDSTAITRWAAEVLEAAGIAPSHARLAAEILGRTSLRGIDSHGVSRIPVYLQRIAAGEITSNDPAAEWREGALRVDGRGALGQVVASFAVDQLVKATEKVACAACVITNCGHLSALGMFALQAAEQRRAALVCQRTPPVMGLLGSPKANIGNNPIAFAAPVRGGTPLVFDMANSVASRVRIQQAARDNAAIPAGWAVNAEGQPTTEAAAALLGYLQPMAAHKGLGLAMMVEVLTSGLAGWTAELAASPQAGSSGVGAFILALNPALFCGQDAFEEGTHRWLRQYLAAAGPGSRFPGQRAAAIEKERRTHGIPIPAGVVRDLREAGRAVGRDFDLSPAAAALAR